MSRPANRASHDRTDNDEHDDDDGDDAVSGPIPWAFGAEVGGTVGGVGGWVGIECAGVATWTGCGGGLEVVGCVCYGGGGGTAGATFFEEVDVVAFLYCIVDSFEWTSVKVKRV